ncbi:MAG: hypothetical protein IJT59_06215 [Desulfovibrionaceae bacterium]|nr:hypothetical protein [Desulfovibrionaceae bacterium]
MAPNLVVTDTDPGKAGRGRFYTGRGARSGVIFKGKNVAEVMGNDNGLPIQGFEGDGKERKLDLSHIELERSLMSHQSYRNYNNFMEAEIALLQDIGYKIDRKNFFGKTIFGDNQTVRNTQGFFARNSDGTAYIDGEENTALMGLGLHIYGKSNTVTQAADILAGGEAAVGMRIDGSDNTLRLPSNINVEANGKNGTALLVAYGKNHEITSQGNLIAEGKGGIAARFDFGHNLVGDHDEYRGSWILTDENKNVNLRTHKRDEAKYFYNLDGPLVKQFDVSGNLVGKKAAIYISDNAFVKNINILKGANVEGHIVSDWDPKNRLVQYSGAKTDLHTKLTFGYSETSTGKASTKVANNFDLDLKGSIDGPESIDMEVAGGKLDVAGTVNVYSLKNKGYLVIRGTDKNGIAANVTKDFTNTNAATLETAVYKDGAVPAIKARQAKVAGTWALVPEVSYYNTALSNFLDDAVNGTDFAFAKFVPNIRFLKFNLK